MKKTVSILLSIILLLSLTACGGTDTAVQAEVIEVNTAQNSETFVEGEDYQQSSLSWGCIYAHWFTRGENGYYFCDNLWAARLYYYDIATDTTIPLCNRPNCTHEDGTCNAVIHSFMYEVNSIQYYDGNLYLIGYEDSHMDELCLYRMSADGTSYGKVGTFLSVSGDGNSFSYAVHRGYAYCAQMGNGTDKRTVEVYRLSLGGGEEAEIVHTFDAAYGGSAFLKAYGNYLYMEHQYYADADANGYGGDLYRMNIHDGTVELVGAGIRREYIIDEKYLYYDSDTQVIARSWETGEETVIADSGAPVYLGLEGGYLVIDNLCGLDLSYYWDDTDTDIYANRCIRVVDTAAQTVVSTVPLPEQGTDVVAWYSGKLIIIRPFYFDYEEENYGFSGYLNEFSYGDLLGADTPEWTVFHTQKPKY